MLKLQYSGHLMQKADSLEKTLMLGKIEGRRRREGGEDEMSGWHHQLDGHELEQAPGDGEGQGSLDSQEPSPTPQSKGITSSVLSFLYGPTLTSIHDHWKNCSFD